MIKHEDVIGTEFGGWPIYKMNLKEILLALGLKDDGTYLKIDINNPILNIYPELVIDDGMGYGVDANFITEVSVGDDFITIFRDKYCKEQVEEFYRDCEEMQKLIEQFHEDKKLIDQINNKSE